MRTLVLVVFLLLSFSTLLQGFGDRGESDGQPLEDLTKDFVTSDAWQVVLEYLGLMGFPFSDMRVLWEEIDNTIGYDISNPRERHQLAVKLYGIKNLESLAELFRLSPSIFRRHYDRGIGLFKEAGGITGIETFARVLHDFEMWVLESGFPELPLKGTAAGEVEEKMRKWQSDIFGIKAVSEAKLMMITTAEDLLLPIKQSPAYVSLVIRGSRHTDELLSHLCLKRETYKLLKEKHPPPMTRAIAELILSFMDILKELNKIGLFSLK